jgi:anti-anti-sigma factor
MAMPIEQWSDEVSVVRLGDDPQFTEDMNAADQHLETHRHPDIILDFSGVTFMNSTNISRLLTIRQKTIGGDCKLVLCGVSQRLWTSFLATGLDKVFTFTKDVSTALATLAIG